MNTSIRCFFMAALLLSGSVLAGGHTGGGGMQMHGGEGMGIPPRLAEKLDLTNQQQQDLVALMGLYGPRIKAIAERGKADREALVAVAPDDAAYGELSARVSQEAGLAAAEVVILLTELQTNLYALLNTDQQAKYLAMRTDMQQRMQERRESWQQGDRPGHHGKHSGKHGDGEQCPHHAEKHGAEASPAS
jgi:hypothetical protein